MDAKLRVVPLQHPCHVGGNKCAMMDRMMYGRAISATHFRTKDSWRRECVFRVVSSVKGEQSKFEPAMVGEKQRQEEYRNASEMKTTLYQSLQGINRGIFGVPSSRKMEIEGLVRLLESCNPNPLPTADLQKVGGSWKLIYSTISILGTKRTKLGLRDFVSLEDFLQIIDVDGRKAVNVINFHVKGFNLLKGKLTILASFKIASSSRVEIEYQDSTISPDQLLNIFKKNYDLLLAIFNPDGWLDITYVDEDMRIGRDDKGNLFVLERV